MERYRFNIDGNDGAYYVLIDAENEDRAREEYHEIHWTPGELLYSVEGPFEAKDDNRAANR